MEPTALNYRLLLVNLTLPAYHKKGTLLGNQMGGTYSGFVLLSKDSISFPLFLNLKVKL